MARILIWSISEITVFKWGLEEMLYTCPVCCYPGLERQPRQFLICPSCGTEFGYDDATLTHEVLRYRWIQNGAAWHSRAISKPHGWDPWVQLALGGRL